MKRKKIEINTPFIKLDSFLKFCGASETGGIAKERVQSGYVFVNDEICTVRGKKLVPGMVVRLENYEYEVASGED